MDKTVRPDLARRPYVWHMSYSHVCKNEHTTDFQIRWSYAEKSSLFFLVLVHKASLIKSMYVLVFHIWREEYGSKLLKKGLQWWSETSCLAWFGDTKTEDRTGSVPGDNAEVLESNEDGSDQKWDHQSLNCCWIKLESGHNFSPAKILKLSCL